MVISKNVNKGQREVTKTIDAEKKIAEFEALLGDSLTDAQVEAIMAQSKITSVHTWVAGVLQMDLGEEADWTKEQLWRAFVYACKALLQYGPSNSYKAAGGHLEEGKEYGPFVFRGGALHFIVENLPEVE